MPPRQAVAAAGGAGQAAAAAAAASIRDLPDDVLARVLGFLTLEERHRHAAPVCQLWRALANSAALLRSIDVYIGSGMPRWRSFFEWLTAHAAGKVEQLRLAARAHLATHEEMREGQELISVALAACGRSLTSLEMEGFLSPRQADIGPWAACMPRLETLHLDAEGEVGVCGPVHRLTSLRRLHLYGSDGVVYFDEDVRLPPSLTGLHCNLHYHLPPQTAALPELLELTFTSSMAEYDDPSFDRLARLAPSLTRLELCYDSSLPACLSALTKLGALVVHCDEDAPAGPERDAPLSAALPHLRRLTYLDVQGTVAVPPTLASCSQLQRLCWWDEPPQWEPPLPDQAALPAGAWLRQLRQLALPLPLAARSLHLLQAAPQLHHLAIKCSGNGPAHVARLRALLEQVQRLPSLRRLLLRFNSEVSTAMSALLLEAQRANPTLYIHPYSLDMYNTINLFSAWWEADPAKG